MEPLHLVIIILNQSGICNNNLLYELPLSFVEYVGFYELLKILQPSIETTSKNIIIFEILKLYNIENTKTMSILKAYECRIIVTIDMWTIGNQMKRYMLIMPHYIDSSWMLQSGIMR